MDGAALPTATQTAQFAQPAAGGEPIGSIESVAGEATALRAGDTVTLAQGDPVYQDDLIQTGPSGSVNIIFNDQSNFAVGENGAMSLDAFVYDANAGAGEMGLSMIQGVFRFVSGNVAKLGPDAMQMEVPVGTIGVRGTQGLVKVDPNADPNAGEPPVAVSMLEDVGGGGAVGEITLTTGAGTVVLSQANATAFASTPNVQPTQVAVFEPSQIRQVYGGPQVDALMSRDGFEIRPSETIQQDVQQRALDAEQPDEEQSDPDEQLEAPTDVIDVIGLGDPPPGEPIPEPEPIPPGDGRVTIFPDPLPGDPFSTIGIPDPFSEPDPIGPGFDDGGIEPEALIDPITGEPGEQDFIAGTLAGGPEADDGEGEREGGGGFDPNDLLGGPPEDEGGGIAFTLIEGTPTGETLEGDVGPDEIFGFEGDDVLFGGDGDDRLIGGTGNDSLTGGLGEDVAIFSGAQSDYMIEDLGGGEYRITDTVGTDGVDSLSGIEALEFSDGVVATGGILNTYDGDGANDSYIGTAGNDLINGAGGDDTLNGGDGDDTIFGGTGADTLSGDVGADSLGGGAGDDRLEGGADDDVLDGGADNDTLLGDAGADTLIGGDGNDKFIGGQQDDFLFGGAGDDFATYSGVSSDYTVTSDPGGFFVVTALSGADGVDTLYDVETLVFTDGPIEINAAAGVATTIIGDGADNDTFGTANDDVFDGQGGADTFDGLGGTDTAFYAGASSSVTLSKDGSTIFADDGSGLVDTLINVESLYFDADSTGIDEASVAAIATPTAGADMLAGRSDANVIDGLGGDDQIDGLSGDDDLLGGSGNDTLFGGDGADELYGGGDDDSLFGGAGDDILEGGLGVDVLKGEAGDDTITGKSGDDIDGGAGLDTLNVVGGGDVVLTAANNIEKAVGSSGDDTFDATGMTDSVRFEGETGADTLITGSVGGTLDGGGGDDVLTGGAGIDTLFGGTGNDAITAQSDDVVDGGAGTDILTIIDAGNVTIASAQGVETAFGGGGDDTLDGTGLAVAVRYEGGAGADVLTAGSAGGTLSGGSGADVLIGGTGTDTFVGGAGDDQFTGSAGDVFDGGVGADTLSVTGPGGVALIAASAVETVFGGVGADTLDGTGLTNAVRYEGGVGADTLNAGDNGGTLDGGADDDTLTGGSGDDTLYGGVGTDIAYGGAGDDHIAFTSGDGTLSMSGGAGNDTFVFDGGGSTFLEAVTGADLVSTDLIFDFASGDKAVIVDAFGATGVETIADVGAGKTYALKLDANGGANDDFIVLEATNMVTADDGDDVVLGSTANDHIFGGAGDDLLLGDDGVDTLEGGDGADELNGGAGDDTLVGGIGDDTAIYTGPQANYVVTDLGGGVYTVEDTVTGDGFDSLSDIETLSFSDGEVDITALGGVNTIAGTPGPDVIAGTADADYFDGEASDDTFNGGSGDDTIVDSDGADTLSGDAGDDTIGISDSNDQAFGGAGNDIIEVDISGVGPITQTAQGGGDNDTLRFVNGAVSDYVFGYTAGGGATVQAILESNTDNFVLASEFEFMNVGGVLFEIASVLQDGIVTRLGDDGNNVLTGTNAEALFGFGGDDDLTGNALASTLDGGAGNDRLFGGSGNDVLLDGAGDDSLSGDNDDDLLSLSFGDDTAFGGFGDDRFIVTGTGNKTFVETGGGTDNITLGGAVSIDGLDHAQQSGADLILNFLDGSTVTIQNFDMTGQEIEGIFDVLTITNYNIVTSGSPESMANDFIVKGAGADVINAVDGDDIVFAGDGDDVLNLGIGNDIAYGDQGADQINGGDGDDFMDGGAGDDTIDGGVGGLDTVFFNEEFGSSNIVSWNGTTLVLRDDFVGNGDEGQDTLTEIETIEFADGKLLDLSILPTGGFVTGTAGPDSPLDGGAGDETVYGLDGDDVVNGLAGNDALFGGNGADQLNGGTGDDTFYGGVGDDTYTGGAGSDRYIVEGGFSGTDTVSSVGADALDTLIARDADGDTIAEVVAGERIGDDLLLEFASNTVLLENHFAGRAVSLLMDDNLGVAYDVGVGLTGSAGKDLLAADGGGGAVDGGGDDDILLGSSSAVDTLYGGNGNDNLNANGANDTMYGGAGDDNFFADGDALIDAGAGNDFAFDFLAGTMNVNLGDGDDGVRLDYLDVTDLIDGGSGFDILEIGSTGSFDLAMLNLTNMEMISSSDPTSNLTLDLDAASVAASTTGFAATASMTISGDSGDQVNLDSADGWTVTDLNAAFTEYTAIDGTQVLVENEVARSIV